LPMTLRALQDELRGNTDAGASVTALLDGLHKLFQAAGDDPVKNHALLSAFGGERAELAAAVMHGTSPAGPVEPVATGAEQARLDELEAIDTADKLLDSLRAMDDAKRPPDAEVIGKIDHFEGPGTKAHGISKAKGSKAKGSKAKGSKAK
jgi:hypothetical protein